MYKIFKRPQVVLDLIEIAEYLSRDSLEQVSDFLKKAEVTFHELSLNPKIGTLRNYGRKNLTGLRILRINKFKNYLILYFVHQDKIEIMNVVHGARNLKSFLSPD